MSRHPRGAAGRHAELLVAIPTVALDARVSWQPIDPSRALANFALGRDVHEITVTVGPSGALEELVMMRWGAGGSTLGFHVFGAALSDEGTFGGIAIPRQVTAGWHYGTDRWNEGAFIRWMVVAPTTPESRRDLGPLSEKRVAASVTGMGSSPSRRSVRRWSRSSLPRSPRRQC